MLNGVSRTKQNDKIINKSNRSLINYIYYDVEQMGKFVDFYRFYTI